MLSNNPKTAAKRKLSPLMACIPIFVLIPFSFAPRAEALSFDQQINELKQANTQVLENKQQLSNEALGLSDIIAHLQANIATLDDQIGQNTQKVGVLQGNIAKAEKDLADQRGLLAVNVRKMYTEQGTTTLEMLASSHDFNHFVDQEQYHSSLQKQINTTTKRIKNLTKQLNSEKQSADNLLSDQKAMQTDLVNRRAEGQRLLGLNQQQQAEFESNVQANSEKIAQLERDQAAENSKGFVSPPVPAIKTSGATYPYANAPFPNALSDPWGMYQRQCVSYTAWKVADSGRHMPYWGGRGNANQWDDNARAAGIPVDNNPRVGDVAISNAGTYGHAMYVEAVNGDGTVYVSQYNADLMGHYSEGTRKIAGLVFIHFP